MFVFTGYGMVFCEQGVRKQYVLLEYRGRLLRDEEIERHGCLYTFFADSGKMYW